MKTSNTKQQPREKQTPKSEVKIGLSATQIIEIEKLLDGASVIDIGKHVNRMPIVKTLRKLGALVSDKPIVYNNRQLRIALAMPSISIPNEASESNALSGLLDGLSTRVLTSDDRFIAAVKMQPKTQELIDKIKDIMTKDDIDMSSILGSFAPMFMNGGSVLSYEFENVDDPSDVLNVKANLQKVLPMDVILAGAMKHVLPGIGKSPSKKIINIDDKTRPIELS